MGYYIIYDNDYKIIGLSSQKQDKSVFVSNIEGIRITQESYFDINNNVIVTQNEIYEIDKKEKNDYDLDVDLV